MKSRATQIRRVEPWFKQSHSEKESLVFFKAKFALEPYTEFKRLNQNIGAHITQSTSALAKPTQSTKVKTKLHVTCKRSPQGVMQYA